MNEAAAHPWRETWPHLVTAVVRTVRHDRIAQLGLAAFLLSLGLQVAAFAGAPLPAPLAGGGIPLLFPGGLLLALLWRLPSIEASHERRFWLLLAVGGFCWLLAQVLFLLFPDGLDGVDTGTMQQTFLALSYVFTILAADGRSHRRQQLARRILEEWLIAPAIVFFVAGLMLYFLFIPRLTGSPGSSDVLAGQWFYAVVDAYLVVRLLYFSRSAPPLHWRVVYLLFAVSWSPILAADVQNLVSGDLPASPFDRVPPGWLCLAFLFFILTARVRHHTPRAAREALEVERQLMEVSLLPSVQTLAFALTFPLFHVVAYRFDLFDHGAAARDARVELVVAVLVVLGLLAFVQRRLFERRAREMWGEHVRFEEELRSSEKDLRLMIERNTVEELVRAGEQRFNLAFKACPSALSISDQEYGRFVEVNPAFEELFGFDRDEVLGRSAEDLGLWGDPQDFVLIRRILEEETEIRELPLELRRRSGEACLVLLSAAQIELDGKRHLLSIVRDVSERHEEEKRLKQRAALLDRAEAAVFTVDGEGRVSTWNRGAERLYGWRAGEVLRGPLEESLDPGGELPACTGQALSHFELEHATKDGRRIAVDAWCVRVAETASRLVVSLPRGDSP